MTVVARGVDPKLLERAEGLSVLEAALAEATPGLGGRLVLVRGKAGIGKTALVRRFCGSQRPPVRILWGTCEVLFTPPAAGTAR